MNPDDVIDADVSGAGIDPEFVADETAASTDRVDAAAEAVARARNSSLRGREPPCASLLPITDRQSLRSHLSLVFQYEGAFRHACGPWVLRRILRASK